MSRDASPSAASMRIARHLLAGERPPEPVSDPELVGAALQRTCLRVTETLRDSMGEDGCNALLVRALARTNTAHPVLKDVRRLDGDGIRLDGVIAAVEAHGVASVTAAVEALLAALVDILGRLIGEDMALQLIDQGAPRSQTSDGAQAP